MIKYAALTGLPNHIDTHLHKIDNFQYQWLCTNQTLGRRVKPARSFLLWYWNLYLKNNHANSNYNNGYINEISNNTCFIANSLPEIVPRMFPLLLNSLVYLLSHLKNNWTKYV